MSTTIDSKIVEMRFDNQQFESGVKTSISTLDKLKQSLKLDDTKKGMEDVGKSINNIKFDGISNGLNDVKMKFSAFQVAGMAAISRLTNSVIDAGKRMGNALISPIVEGGKRRAQNIAQAKFQFQGLGMDIEKAMEDANYAVADTAYGLDAAAKAAAMFGATGIKVGDEMKMSLRAISGVAAMTSSEYEDIASIFTTIAGNGRVMGENLNSLASRGVNAAAILGKALGKSEADIRKLVSKGEIDFKTFAKVMDDTFGEHSKKANETFSGAMSNIRAAMSKIGADFATPFMDAMIGPLNSIRLFFNKIRKTITPFSTELGEQFHVLADIFDKTMSIINSDDFEFTGLNKLVDTMTSFIRLGGVTNIIQGLANTFRALNEFVAPVKEAFRDFFPETTTLTIVKITKAFAELTNLLKPSADTIDRVKRIFSGLFAALDMGRMILQALFTPLTFILTKFGILSHDVGEATANLGDWVVSLREAAIESKIFEKIANKITDVMEAFSLGLKSGIAYLRELLNTLRDSISLKGFDTIKESFRGLGDQLKDSTTVFEKARVIIVNVFTAIGEALGDLPAKLSSIFGAFAKYISQVTAIVGAIGLTDIIRRLVLALNKLMPFIKSGNNPFSGLANMFKQTGNAIKTAFETMDSALITMQNNLRIGQLLQIAAAVGVLAASMSVIANIDSKRLGDSLATVSVLLTEVMGSIYAMTKFGNVDKTIKTAAKSLISLSAAIYILAKALQNIALIKPEALVGSMVVMTVLLAELVGVMFAMSKMESDMIKGASGLIAMSISILILSKALQSISKLTSDPESLLNSLLVITDLILTLGIFAKITGGSKNLLSIGIGLIGVATAITILTAAMKIIATMSPKGVIQSLVGIGVLLAELAVGLRFMKFALPGAAALLVASAALVALGAALKIISSIKGSSLAKSIITIGAALVELAIGCTAMIAALPGAIALSVASVGLIALASAFKIMAGIKWTSLVKDLIVVLAAMGGMAIIGTVAIAAVPGLLAISAAFLAVSASVVLFGVGIASISSGLIMLGTAITMLGTTSPIMIQAFIKSLEVLIAGFLTLIPNVSVTIGEALITIAEVVGKGAPIIGEAFIKIVYAITDAIIQTSPKIVEAFVVLFESLIKGVRQNTNVLVEEFVGLLNDILSTFAKYIPSLTESGKAILFAIIDGISTVIPDLVDASFKAMIAFVNGLADAIEENVPILEASIDRLVDVIKSALLGGLGENSFIGQMIESGANAVQGFINGLKTHIKTIFGLGQEIGQAAVNGLNSKNGLDEHSPSVKTHESGYNADMGVIEGIEEGLPKVEKMGESLGSAVYNGADSAADAGGQSLLASVEGNNANILTSFVDYLSKLSVLKQEETQILSQKHKYPVSEEQAYINTLTAMRNKHQKRVEEQRDRDAKNADAYNKTLKNMREKYTRQHENLTAVEMASRKLNADSKAEEANSITESEAQIADVDSKSTKSAKDNADKKKKVYAEMTKEEKAYWENVLNLHKQGTEAIKYADMDILEFQETVVEEAGDLIDKYMDKYDSTIDKFMDKGGIFEAIKEQEAVSKEELQNNLQGQIDQLNEFAGVVLSLDQRLQGTNLQQAIQEMGVDSLQQLKALNSMTDEELNNYVVLYDTKYAAAQKAAIGQLGGLQRETEAKLSQMFGGVSVNLHSFISEFDGTFNSVKKYVNEAVAIGGNISSGLAEGIAKNAGEAKDAAVSAVDDKNGTTKAMKDELDINSPSGVARDEIGAMIDFGLRDGIEKNMPAVRISVRRLMVELINTMKEYGKDFYDAGVNIANGLIKGIKESEPSVVIAAEAMAKAAYDAAKAKLKINSPSKMFYGLGKFSGIGLVNALKDSVSSVGKAGATMAMEAYERASEILKSGVEINPTISPVLDLSNIEEGSKRIDDLSSNWNDISISGNMASVTARNFNTARSAALAENQNGLDLLRNAINALSGGSNTMTQNNTFNISGDDPRAIADEVSRVLQMQVERRGAVWA